MNILTVDIVDNKTRDCPVYDIWSDAEQLDRFAWAPVVRLGKKYKYLNIPCAFDIETTNVIVPEKERTATNRPYAFMYHWQFCLGNPQNDYVVFFGRTWEDFRELIRQLISRLRLGIRKLVCYVHNLAFEWQYIRRFLTWTDVFLKDLRQPLKAVCNDAIEFRDSYALSNMSLAKWCEHIPGVTFTKNDGEKFDYRKRRYPWTVLTRQEQSYCYCDVASVCECVAYLMQTDNLARIPLTSTGYVRRDFRRAYKKNKSLWFDMRLYRLTEQTFEACRAAFRGGNTHGHYEYVGELLENVQSFDISSSYPAAMLYGRYPTTAFTAISPELWLKKDRMPEWAALIHVKFENIRYIGTAGIPYIPIDKCKCSSCRINDNGRVLRCGPYDDGRPGYVEMWITDIDLQIIEHDYTWSGRWVDEVYISKYGPLPEEHKQQLMKYFAGKTKLKGVESQEYFYQKEKNRLNAGFGMMVYNPIKLEWEYVNGDYISKPLNVQEALDEYYNNKSSFLRYEQGVWVTAIARLQLQRMLWVVGRDVVYVDTDSIKCLGDHRAEFEEYNKEIIRQAEELGYYADDPAGRRHYPGAWEYEGTYIEFKFLGAKRYIVKEYDKKAGKAVYKTTIAGVAKKGGAEYFNKHGIDAFEDGCVIEGAGHTVAYYNDDEIHTITLEGRQIETAANVALADETYKLGLTGEYVDLLRKFVDNIGLFM